MELLIFICGITAGIVFDIAILNYYNNRGINTMYSDKVYDILNKIQRWLPALGIFYLSLGKIWGLPWAGEINQTIVALATLLAATLEVSSARYYKKESEANQSNNYDNYVKMSYGYGLGVTEENEENKEENTESEI